MNNVTKMQLEDLIRWVIKDKYPDGIVSNTFIEKMYQDKLIRYSAIKDLIEELEKQL